MNKGILNNYNRNQSRLNIILLIGSILYILLSTALQYHEKKLLLDQQATYISRVIRNDLITGNQYYIYEQCRSLLADMSIEKLSITRNNRIFCDEKKSSNSFFPITTSIPISYNPYLKAEHDNIVGFISLSVRSDSILLSTAISFIFFFALIFFFYRAQRKYNNNIKSNIIKPLSLLADIMRNDPSNVQQIEKVCSNIVISDIKVLFTSYLTLITQIELAKNQIREQSKLAATHDVSTQVAHDIRSPLAALNMVMNTLTSFNETDRNLTRNAIQRINDIANNLLNRVKQENLSNETFIVPTKEEGIKEVELIPDIVDMLVSEKRMQYYQHSNIKIEVKLIDCFAAFSVLNASEFKRVLSNIINNSIESIITEVGQVLVTVKKDSDYVTISIKDNGKGIPPHLIDKLGTEKMSYNKDSSKESGNGLGLYHAKRTIESFGGKLNISSVEGSGTTITIKLVLAPPPYWFPNIINLNAKKYVISLDDDSSIHEIWTSRLINLKNEIAHIKFQSGDLFSQYVQEHFSNRIDMQFLIDYELLNQSKTGLELMKELSIISNSILVTSRYEDPNIKEQSKLLGFKILPKSLAAFIPISNTFVKNDATLILLDNDELVRITWEMKAKKSNKKIICFATATDLRERINEFNSDTLFYIDVNLSPTENGEEVAHELFERGFRNIYLATGHNPENFKHLSWIKGVVGKSPPETLS